MLAAYRAMSRTLYNLHCVKKMLSFIIEHCANPSGPNRHCKTVHYFFQGGSSVADCSVIHQASFCCSSAFVPICCLCSPLFSSPFSIHSYYSASITAGSLFVRCLPAASQQSRQLVRTNHRPVCLPYRPIKGTSTCLTNQS